MSLLNAIKAASLGAVDATSPVAVMRGVVQEALPLKVKVDQRFTLTEPFLIVPDYLLDYRVLVGGEELVIRRGLEQGDHVVLLRVQGGQQYAILSRVVAP